MNESPQQTYTTIMVPVVIPTPPTQNQSEEKSEPSDRIVIGALLWAVILLLAFWFITGGYKLLQ